MARDPQRGKAMVFHLLIPSWAKLCIKEPLQYPKDLYSLHIEGMTHGGKAQVELSLPAAPRGLLQGITNVLDPNSWNSITEWASVGIMFPTVGWGVNGACAALGFGLGAMTGFGALVAVPIWAGSGLWAMDKTAPAPQNAIYESLCEEAPRVLGSNRRLEQKKMFY